MGWKKIKEHYRINHSVCITDEGICIGSAYIHNIIVFKPDGTFVKKYDLSSRANDDLRRYQMEMDADPAKLKELIDAEDTFTQSLPVFTYKSGEVIEKKCEEYGWPNITHDGEMMYDNTFSPDKMKVVAWAKNDAQLGIKFALEAIEQKNKELNEMQDYLAEHQRQVDKLKAEYPDAVQ